MCGCMGPDQLAAAKDVAVMTAMFAAPVGMAVSLVASVVLLNGGRQRLSWSMLGIGAVILALIAGENIIDLETRLRETIFVTLWAVFLFLGLLSLVYWPTQARWVNRPLVIGIGVSLLAALSHTFFMQLSAWLAVTAAS